MRKLLSLFIMLLVMFVFIACPINNTTNIPELNSYAWEYSSDTTKNQYLVPNDASSVTIDSAVPLNIYMARINPTVSVINKENQRYIINSGFVGRLINIELKNDISNTTELFSNKPPILEDTRKQLIREDFKPAQDFVLETMPMNGSNSDILRSVSVSEPLHSTGSLPVTQITPTVGDTTKDIWIDVNSSKSSEEGVIPIAEEYYKKEKATLRAVGTNCYVWVIEANYDNNSESKTDNKVTTSQAIAVQQKFDSMYQYIRNVFGEESDKMIDSTGTLVNGENVSDTGKKVNIVITDIGGDATTEQTGGVYGYFWAKDYFACKDSGADMYSISNEGKYFYIDSHFYDSAPKQMYSTLAHEFQHMINFGQKSILHNKYSSMPYNEMLSLLCEDMVQEFLELKDDESPKGRLTDFCAGYYFAGLTDWMSGNWVYYSYANSYAFGAYLIRNYGGIELLKEIATNNSVDIASINSALRSRGYSFDDVFKNYPLAMLLNNTSNALIPSFNKSVSYDANSDGTNEYDMTPINIFDYSWTYSGTTYHGPAKFVAGANGRSDLRPYGLTLHPIGSTSAAGKTTISFSTSKSTSEKVYLIVEPIEVSN